MRSMVATSFFFLSGFFPSYAATECYNAESTIAIQNCFIEAQAKAEKALNNTYQRLISRSKYLDAKDVDDLRHAERAWISFRDSNCQFYRDLDRVRHDFEHSDCMLRMTREREIELGRIVENLNY